MLRNKLRAHHQSGTKHDRWFVYCGEVLRGMVTDSHGDGEMRNREIGHVARSLGVSERELKELVSCTMSREQNCATP